MKKLLTFLIALIVLALLIVLIRQSSRAPDFEKAASEARQYSAALAAGPLGELGEEEAAARGVCSYISNTHIDLEGNVTYEYRHVTMRGVFQRLRCMLGGGAIFVQGRRAS